MPTGTGNCSLQMRYASRWRSYSVVRPAQVYLPSGVDNIFIINKVMTPGRVTAIIVNERFGF